MRIEEIFSEACKKGIYFKDLGEIRTWGIDDSDQMIIVDFKENRLILLYRGHLKLWYEDACLPGDYGKTWALTREELEEKKQ